ncbi:MAG: ribbon-helix-helix protein, CopG family [Deltaproteobacteria bacterium]|nr:ribbon-helix-helix protein, CopG family [Deltaproteobacteria bacterium]
MSRPLQVYLEDDDLDRLDAWSRARGWTKSQTIRAAVRALLRSETRDDPLLTASGMIDGLPSDLSERFDEHLGATFVAERAPAYHGKTRTARKRPGR